MKTKKPDADIRRSLSKRWYAMISRCTDPAHQQYQKYGAVGVKVCRAWLDKETFIRDCKTLPGYDPVAILKNSLHLDKDSLKKGNKIYSPSTCAFISITENNKVKPSQMVVFIATSPEGKEYIVKNQSEFAAKHDLRQSTISDCLKGRVKRHRGWTFRYKE